MEFSCSSSRLSREEDEETSADNKDDFHTSRRGKRFGSLSKANQKKKNPRGEACAYLGLQTRSRQIHKRRPVFADRHIPLLGSDPRGRGARVERQQAAEELRKCNKDVTIPLICLHQPRPS